MTPPATQPEVEPTTLLQEHEELVQLYVHEDSLAWQLNLAFITANAALFAAANSLGAFDPKATVGVLLVLVLAGGALVNVVGFLVLQRSKIHRQSRLFRAYSLEAELRSKGYPIETFTSAEGNIYSGRMLVCPELSSPAPSTTRPLRLWEQLEVLSLRLVFNALATTFLALALWVFAGRPWL